MCIQKISMKKLFIIFFAVISLSHVFAQESDCKISYEKLKDNLYYDASHHFLSVFVNLDYGLSQMLVQDYVLRSMELRHHDEGCRWEDPHHWVEEYRPAVLVGDEIKYLKIHYYIKETDDTPMIPTRNGKCNTLVKCEIVGTPTLILQFLSHYWEREVEIGGPSKGEKAHIDFMGDHIALYHINENLYKIVITDNGRDFNYKCNFRKEK